MFEPGEEGVSAGDDEQRQQSGKHHSADYGDRHRDAGLGSRRMGLFLEKETDFLKWS